METFLRITGIELNCWQALQRVTLCSTSTQRTIPHDLANVVDVVDGSNQWLDLLSNLQVDRLTQLSP